MNAKSQFILKYCSSYKVVSVLKKIIISDFAETNIVVPFLFLLKIVFEFKSILGFLLVIYYYFICEDETINWNVERNTEISKYRCNIFKGITGMNRDLNMILVAFHKSFKDTREVFFLFYFLLYFKKNLKTITYYY
jgi:hypothetical protein